MMQNYNIASTLTVLVIMLSHSSNSSLRDGDYSEEDLDYDKDFDKYDAATSSGWVESDEPHPPGPLNLRGSLRRRFAMDTALADPYQSLVCSPLSALLPLGKLALGATGKCLEQLLSAIGLGMLSQLNKAFKPLLNDLEFLKGVTLSVVSKIYVSKEQRLVSKFRKRAKRIFKADVVAVDFKRPPAVAKLINRWVSSKTQRKIKNIISDRDITPRTSLLLVNAVYFSGKWVKPFEKVEEQNFYTASATRRIPMMIREDHYNYSNSESLDAQIVEIPYEGEQASFVIILPNSKDALSVMLEKIRLAPELMQKALAKLVPTDIILHIPKFKTSSHVDLNAAYKLLGVTEMFQNEASGLDNIVRGGNDIHVSKAVQRAVIEVDERGTTAAASSALQVQLLSYWNVDQIIFVANHPFAYFIKYKKEQIFSGIFVN